MTVKELYMAGHPDVYFVITGVDEMHSGISQLSPSRRRYESSVKVIDWTARFLFYVHAEYLNTVAIEYTQT